MDLSLFVLGQPNKIKMGGVEETKVIAVSKRRHAGVFLNDAFKFCDKKSISHGNTKGKKYRLLKNYGPEK